MLPYLRTFDRNIDYSMIAGWWRIHGWEPVPLIALPPLAHIAHFADGQDAAFACLYMDNGGTGVCMLEWIVTNPINTARQSIRAIKALTEFIESEAKRMNYSVMLTTAKQQGLCQLHERNGFTRTDGGMTHFIKSLL